MNAYRHFAQKAIKARSDAETCLNRAIRHAREGNTTKVREATEDAIYYMLESDRAEEQLDNLREEQGESDEATVRATR